MAHVVLVGQAFVDVLDEPDGKKVRLGGVFHAARALWALHIPYSICYVGPAYLDEEIATWATNHNVTRLSKIGNIIGCPNVVLVADAKEVGDQGYVMLLEAYKQTEEDISNIESLLSETKATDVLIFPGAFNLPKLYSILAGISIDVHMDAIFAISSDTKNLGRKLSTLILSTSSASFLEEFRGDVQHLERVGREVAENILVKENRGGSRFFSDSATSPFLVPAQTTQVAHSVGVGDCYNAVYVGLRRTFKAEEALAYASFVATDYARELDDEMFRLSAKRTMLIPPEEIAHLGGISLPWEDRQSINVYVAAPDFRMVNRKHIEAVTDSLRYHNFRARLPVQEHGEIDITADTAKRRETAEQDIKLLEECDILIAVLEYNDPGTFIEMGIAFAKNIPILIYDPYHLASNLMVTSTAELVTENRDELISEVFRISCARLHKKNQIQTKA